MTLRPRMTPQERMRLAVRLNKLAKSDNLTLHDRKEARRHASNMVAINLSLAKRKKAD